jgi:hypothetical protein
MLDVQGFVESATDTFRKLRVAELARSVHEKCVPLHFLAIGDAGVKGLRGLVETKHLRRGALEEGVLGLVRILVM